MSKTSLSVSNQGTLGAGVSDSDGPPAASTISLECRDLSKTFGGLRAVADLTATFEAGRLTALVGPNGAGKTTLFHLISGALRPDEGEILFRGRRIDGLPSWAVAQLGIGRLFQDIRVFPRLTVLENVLVAYPAQEGEVPSQALIRPWRVGREEDRRAQHARACLRTVGLEVYENESAEALSFGQQKLLAITRLMAAGAEVLLLDEPTAGVNPKLIDRLLKIIRDLALSGRTVVLIEHNVEVVLKAADWLYFMADGEVRALGLPRDVLSDKSIRKLYLGL